MSDSPRLLQDMEQLTGAIPQLAGRVEEVTHRAIRALCKTWST